MRFVQCNNRGSVRDSAGLEMSVFYKFLYFIFGALPKLATNDITK